MKFFLDFLGIFNFSVKVAIISLVFLGLFPMIGHGIDWYFMAIALILSFLARYFLGFAMMPIAPILIWHQSLDESGKFYLSLIPLILSLLWGSLIFGCWSIYTIQLFYEHSYTPHNFIDFGLGFGIAIWPIVFLNEFGRDPSDYLTVYNANTNNISFFITIALTILFGLGQGQSFLYCFLIFTSCQIVIGLPFALLSKKLRDLYG